MPYRKQMFVQGTREWFGDNARAFLQIRNTIENTLLKRGFSYFCGGLVSKRTIYENNVDSLGEKFLDNLISLQIAGKEEGLIIAPEYTFRVYDYLIRNNMLNEGQVFYSQEFIRNEPTDDVKRGKTFSFWQTGFEIFGKETMESSILALDTLAECLESTEIKNIYFRMSDKRILQGILSKYSLEERRKIYSLIDKCDEQANAFYDKYIESGGNPVTGKSVASLLELGNNESLTIDDLSRAVNNEESMQGIKFLDDVLKKYEETGHAIYARLIPFMPKSWDACDSLLFDARISGYPYAVSGGGNLSTQNAARNIMKSGAGIGITRLVEYVIATSSSNRKVG